MDRPNVLLIMCDQLKATASHLYGNTFCRTPNLERAAQEGVSQYPHSHGSRRNETLMPERAVHAFQIWKEQGFHTGLIGKNHCFQSAEDLALFDTWCEITHGGLVHGAETKGMPWFRPVEAINAAHSVRRNMPQVSPRFSYAHTDFPLEDYSTGLVAGQTVRFLEKHRHDPFVLWVSFPDPHEPYEAPRRYAEKFPPEVIDLPPWREGEFDAGWRISMVPWRRTMATCALSTTCWGRSWTRWSAWPCASGPLLSFVPITATLPGSTA